MLLPIDIPIVGGHRALRDKGYMPRTLTLRRHWIPHICAWLAVALLTAASWLHVWSLIDADRARTIVETEQYLANLTRLAQEHAQRTLRNADQALRFVKAEYETRGDRLDLKALMAQGVIDGSVFSQVGVIDADGIYRLSSLQGRNNLDLSDRAHFRAHIAADTKQLFISKPLVGRASGKWSINLSRRINRPDGSFGGVAVVSLDLNYFTRFYNDLHLGQHGSMAILGLDGVVRASRTDEKDYFGIDASSSPLFAQLHQGQQSGAFSTPSVVDGVERTFFFRRIAPYGMVIVAGIATPDVFATHDHAKAALVLEAILASLLLLALGSVFSAYHKRVQRDIKERKQITHQLAESEHRMEMALNGADLGLWDWHIPSGKFTHNARMTAMLGYASDAPEMTVQSFATLLHPDDWPALKAALYPHLKGVTPMLEVEHRLLHQDRHWVWLLARGKVVERDIHGRAVRMVGTGLDITNRKAAEKEIRQLAFFDPLTGLPNRRLLLDRLQQELLASERSGNCGAVLFVDLDNFKAVNDTLGHDMGDLLLQLVAQRLSACVREGDTVARQGGDEFVVMLKNLSALAQEAQADVQAVGDKILSALNQPYLLGDHVYHSTASIGVNLFGPQHPGMEELMHRADLAMYEAKAAGRNALRFYDAKISAQLTICTTLET